MKSRSFIAITILLISLAACSALGSKAAERKASAKSSLKYILPDDGGKDPSFAQFRERLINAVKAHDRTFVEEIISPEILTAIGGGKGKDSFNQEFDNLSDKSRFWPRIERVLLHGAEFDSESNQYHAPALRFEDSHSEKAQAIVWNKGAKLRKSASETSLLLSTLYDEQVTIIEPAEPEPLLTEWAKVKCKSGKEAYLKTADIYSAYDEFAFFKKSNGKWYLSWFGFAGL
ncbi:MAG: hypothetical protein K2X27_13920 [Candidatus Obscuribacterales bacterium]|nr:hypothetical protein [Candidatus Obscuribacterales bacterium]